MEARNQVGIGLLYRPTRLCSLATQFQARFLELIHRPIAGLKFSLSFFLSLNLSMSRNLTVVHCIKSELYLAKWKWILRSGPKLKMLVKFHRSKGSFPNPLNWWWIRFGCTALDQCYWNKENWFANWKSTMHFSDLHILASTMPLIIEFFIKIKSQFGRFWGQTRIIILSLS